VLQKKRGRSSGVEDLKEPPRKRRAIF